MDFNEKFKLASEQEMETYDMRSKIIESVLELNDAQKVNKALQTELDENQLLVDRLRADNKDIKMVLLRALIEREELESKRKDLDSNIKRLSTQLASLERDSEKMVSGEQMNYLCEQFAIHNQISLLNKIQDAKIKLIKKGFPSYYFAQ